MITVTRYNTISSLPNKMQLVETDIETSEKSGLYCVDTSHFVPKCEAVSVLSAGDVARSGAYDFADGKDSGVNIPRSRSHSYTGDIAEASVNVRASADDAKKAVSEAKEAFEKDVAIKSIKAAYSGSAATGSAATGSAATGSAATK